MAKLPFESRPIVSILKPFEDWSHRMEYEKNQLNKVTQLIETEHYFAGMTDYEVYQGHRNSQWHVSKSNGYCSQKYYLSGNSYRFVFVDEDKECKADSHFSDSHQYLNKDNQESTSLHVNVQDHVPKSVQFDHEVGDKFEVYYHNARGYVGVFPNHPRYDEFDFPEEEHPTGRKYKLVCEFNVRDDLTTDPF